MTKKDFFENNIIKELSFLIEHEHINTAFLLMALSIEYLGAIIDDKPLKAKIQSQKRFNKAINRLFPDGYKFINQNGLLYDKFRNHMIHTFTAGDCFILTNLKNAEGCKHLFTQNNKTVLIAEIMFEDILNAYKKLSNQLV